MPPSKNKRQINTYMQYTQCPCLQLIWNPQYLHIAVYFCGGCSGQVESSAMLTSYWLSYSLHQCIYCVYIYGMLFMHISLLFYFIYLFEYNCITLFSLSVPVSVCCHSLDRLHTVCSFLLLCQIKFPLWMTKGTP